MQQFTKKLFLENVSLYSALLMFPGFFFYHTLVGVGLVPAFFGGFFTPISIIALSLYLISYLVLNIKLTKLFVLCTLFFIYWLLYIYAQYIIKFRINNLSLLIWSLTAIIINYTCFIVMLNININDNKLAKIFDICFLIMCLIVFTYSQDGRFYLKASFDVDGTVSYQAFARSIIFVSYISYLSQKKLLLKILVLIASITVLFINNSRSELIFFICSIFMFTLVNYRNDHVSLIMSILFIALVGINYDYIASNFSNNRIFELLDLSNSSSYVSRDQLEKIAWEVVKNNPFLGDYGYYIDKYGSGSFAHNIISAWADFGIFGILIFLGTVLNIFIFSINKIFLKKSSEKHIQLLFLFSSTLLIAYLFSKDYSYMFFGLTLGLYISYLNSKRNMGIL